MPGKKNKSILTVFSGWSITYIGMNCVMKPFDDPRVRHAIMLGIYRQTVLQAFGSVSTSILLPQHLYYWEEPCFDDYNPAEAKQLLAEA